MLNFQLFFDGKCEEFPLKVVFTVEKRLLLTTQHPIIFHLRCWERFLPFSLLFSSPLPHSLKLCLFLSFSLSLSLSLPFFYLLLYLYWVMIFILLIWDFWFIESFICVSEGVGWGGVVSQRYSRFKTLRNPQVCCHFSFEAFLFWKIR
jgi:hypothetical protein